MSTVLHTLNDGSLMRVMNASELVKIPVWKGNRIIDTSHVAAIRETVGENVKVLDFGYRLVSYDVLDAGGALRKETVLVDGQHRHAVLQEYFRDALFSSDFPVVVTEKQVDSELDIIEYFNMLNHVKSITWSDSKLVCNAYIAALIDHFNKGKLKFIRAGATHRPYLSAEKIREILEKQSLRGGRSNISSFVERVDAWNKDQLRDADLTIALGGKFSEMTDKAAKIGFMLAVDPKLPWIAAALAPKH